MRQRIITGLIGGIAVISLLVSGLNVIRIAVALVSLYALHEMYGAVGIKNNIMLYIDGMIFSAGLIVTETFFPECTMFLMFLYIVTLFLVMLIKHKTVMTGDITVCFFMTIYIVYTLSHISAVRALHLGKFSIFLIFIGAFATDTFAYFVGVTCGKRKLCPEISPKKTIEGAAGGLLGGIICFVITGIIFKFVFYIQVNFVYMSILGLLCGIVSEVGDLAASVVKRQYGIKDYGTLLPGHGGIMDRLDSVIFVAPLVYYFLKNLPVLG